MLPHWKERTKLGSVRDILVLRMGLKVASRKSGATSLGGFSKIGCYLISWCYLISYLISQVPKINEADLTCGGYLYGTGAISLYATLLASSLVALLLAPTSC